jgi:methylenetetrahydrofolate dehydrogenase (NADP+) / methenyltetrahydrofolate cyclohydrolase
VTLRLDGKPVAEATDRASRDALAAGRPGGPSASLVSVHRGVDSPFRFYLRRQAKAAAALGIGFRDIALGAGDGPEALVLALRQLDRDPSVHGVLVEHPLPPPFDFFRAVDELRLEKDVDGVGARNLGRLVGQRPVQVPAVARAALGIARHYRLPLDGESVAVVGRSSTVGLPLALLLAAPPPGANAAVTVLHSRSGDLAKRLAGATTIFSCAGHPGLLSRATVPEGAHVVDVGLSSVPDPERPGAQKAVGDADARALDGWAASLTPIPGGVGPVTVAELMSATVRAWQVLSGVAGAA